MRIAVMQGRLLPPSDGRIQSFPVDGWAYEFRVAPQAGIRGIEWIYEAETAHLNPLGTAAGLRDILDVVSETGVRVSSICADWFMAHPLAYGDSDGVLPWVLERAADLGAEHVVIPFVDASALSSEEIPDAAAALRESAPLAARLGVEMHVETALVPEALRSFLEQVDSDSVRVTWDIGNSASLGFDPRDELASFGTLIGSVHVKDRRLGGGTVPLGAGDADLPAAFAGLRAARYDGWLVLQVARGEDRQELAWVRHWREDVERLWEDAA